LPETWCPTCGFRFDPINESQVLCPACGADPNNPPRQEDDPEIAVAFEDGTAFAEASVSLTEVLGGYAPMEPEVDYVPDPDLEVMIADAEALRAALMEGPVLIAGNKLVN
jgi:hypothetical protein